MISEYQSQKLEDNVASNHSGSVAYATDFESPMSRRTATYNSSDRVYSERFTSNFASGSYSTNSLTQSPENAEKYKHVHQANGGCACGMK